MTQDLLDDCIGTARTEALMRVFIGIPFVIISILFLTPVLIVLAGIRALVIIVASIIVAEPLGWNTDQLSMWLYDIWHWNWYNLRWAITGGASGIMWYPNFTRLNSWINN